MTPIACSWVRVAAEIRSPIATAAKATRTSVPNTITCAESGASRGRNTKTTAHMSATCATTRARSTTSFDAR
jgi:hypothetical protein